MTMHQPPSISPYDNAFCITILIVKTNLLEFRICQPILYSILCVDAATIVPILYRENSPSQYQFTDHNHHINHSAFGFNGRMFTPVLQHSTAFHCFNTVDGFQNYSPKLPC